MAHRIRPSSRKPAPYIFAALACATLSLAACSTTPALVLTATPDSIGGDGQSAVTATAKVTSGGAAAPDGTIVTFTATAGTLEDSTMTPGTTPLSIAIPSTSGASIALLVVPRRGRGSITITASASFNGATVQQSQIVQLTPAGALASTLTFTCATQNIGGLVTNLAAPIHVLCTPAAYDANNKLIPNASIEPYAEAGDLSWYTDPTSGDQSLIYTVNPGATPPLDVAPFGPDGMARPVCPAACINDPTQCDAEPCWVEASGLTHNPRDGVATLMVAVPGVPGFTDAYSDGEPYVDSDDSGAYEPGEFYIDVNGNGMYDSAADWAGAMQNPRMLWKAFRIIWSGSADLSNTSHSSGLSGTVSGSTLNNLTVRLNDSNYNKLAAVEPSDNFELSSSCVPDGDIIGNAFTVQGGVPLDPSNPGIAFDSTTGAIDGPGFPGTYRQETDTNLQTVYGASSIQDNTGASVCSITATVTRTYDPGAGTEYESSGSISSESVTGSFAFEAPPDAGM